MDFKFGNRRLVVLAILVAGVVSVGYFATAGFASAQNSTNTQTIPQLNGSVNVREQMKNFVNENLKVSFTQAAETAQAQVDGGKVLSGNLGVAQGYLVYKFVVADQDGTNGRMVIVDAGNGSVLYTSEAFQLGQYGLFGGYGCPGHFGHGFGHGMNWSGKTAYSTPLSGTTSA